MKLVIDIQNRGSCGKFGNANMMDDPFFFGKASSFDQGLLDEMERLEILLRERRSRLENFLV